MSNNGWIKYSEEKPKCHGEYLVTCAKYVEILMYVTQNDIYEYNILDYQIEKLDRARFKETNKEKAAIIRKEQLALYEKQNSTYIGAFPSNNQDFKEEGFYDWMDDGDGFGSWVKVDVKYWQPLPELPTE